MYIDIHNHTLFGVDDGPEDIEESIEMLRKAGEQGIEQIILTPHYRYGMFECDVDTIEKNYAELDRRVKAAQIGIKLYLGCEYHVDSDIFEYMKEKRCHTLADTDYILTEYSHKSEYAYMKEYTHALIACGYQPVIAHIERYECIAKKPQLAQELSRMGALIQINADSVLGIDGKYMEKICRKLLKHGLVDIVASDAHSLKKRANHMNMCYGYISKKYGEAYASKLFYENSKIITQDIGG